MMHSPPSKLLINNAFSGLSAALNGEYGDILDDETGITSAVHIADETIKVGHANGVHFAKMGGFDVESLELQSERHNVGDVREWEQMGYKVRTYRKIKAKELWNLINVCATYSAEPGIFFIDNANDMTNAKAYGQKVVATNH